MSPTLIKAEPAADNHPQQSVESAFCLVRDDCVRAYQPSNAEEMMLVTQIARAWFRLQKYYDYEIALMEEQRFSEMFDNDLDRFNAFHRALAAAERMWRNAIRELQAARRRNKNNVASPSNCYPPRAASYAPDPERDEPGAGQPEPCPPPEPFAARPNPPTPPHMQPSSPAPAPPAAVPIRAGSRVKRRAR